MNVGKKLLSGSLIVTVGALVGGAFSYLFNLNMARLLGPALYGDLIAIMSFVMIASIGGGAITTITMRYTGELYVQNDLASIKKIMVIFSKIVLLISTVMFLVASLVAFPVSSYFSIHSPWALIIGFFTFIPAFLLVVNRGVLQGMQRFTDFSATNIIEMFLRLSVGLVLVRLGWGIYGATGALLAAPLCTYLLSIYPLWTVLKRKSINSRFKFDKKAIASYSLPTLVAFTFLTIGLNLDIVLVKKLFDPTTAGLYSAISTVAKIVLYVSSPVSTVMFPMVSEQVAKGFKHYRILLFALLMTSGVSLIALAVYYAIPVKIVSILFGSQYVVLSYLLPKVGIIVVCYTLINLMVTYYLAVKNFIFIIFALLIWGGQIVFALTSHPSLEGLVNQMIISMGLLLLTMMAYYFYTKRSQINLLIKNLL